MNEREQWLWLFFYLNKYLDEISFSYKRNEPILDEFSIDVNEGEFVTVLGDSGVGKTTLFRAINNIKH